MGKTRFIIWAIVACLGFAGCSKESTDEEPQELYFLPLGVYLTKGEWKNGETMNMYVYPPSRDELPEHYKYINNIEYYVDGTSIGKTNVSPFSITYIPNLSLGIHALSLELDLNNKNITWETKTTSFTIIE
jgi:hypothetical protein